MRTELRVGMTYCIFFALGYFSSSSWFTTYSSITSSSSFSSCVILALIHGRRMSSFTWKKTITIYCCIATKYLSNLMLSQILINHNNFKKNNSLSSCRLFCWESLRTSSFSTALHLCRWILYPDWGLFPEIEEFDEILADYRWKLGKKSINVSNWRLTKQNVKIDFPAAVSLLSNSWVGELTENIILYRF